MTLPLSIVKTPTGPAAAAVAAAAPLAFASASVFGKGRAAVAAVKAAYAASISTCVLRLRPVVAAGDVAVLGAAAVVAFEL